jgi:undecaprenyl diphosphate synthase
MDGNGRWAQRRNLPRNAGHRAGVKSVDEIVSTCRRLGVHALSSLPYRQRIWSALVLSLKAHAHSAGLLRKEVGRMSREHSL